MFSSETIEFLRDLSGNNTRDWFAENKKRYEFAVKSPATEYGAKVAAELQRATGIPHREKIFRIHRDIRFSKDKTPYNTHVHISFVPEHGDEKPVAWMMGLSPEYFTLGCGIFAFDKPGLERFRKHIAGEEGEATANLLHALATSGVRLSEPDLKRVPAPYDRDHQRGVLLRHKGLVGWIDGSGPEDATQDDVVTRTMADFARLRPLFDLLREV